MTAEKGRPPRSGDELLEWFTVSYRALYIVAAVVVAVAAGGGYLYYRWTRPPPPPPVVAPTATSARFNNIQGSVQVRVAGTLQWVNANMGMVLNTSDLVRTGPGATAEIRFLDGTIFHMRPESLMTLAETSEDPATRKQRPGAKISSGEVNFTTVQDTRILTPTVDALTRQNTAGAVQVKESGESGLRIFRGASVAQTRTGERIELGANQGIDVDQQGRAGEMRSLPDVPVLLAPPDQSEIAYPDIARATTLLAWKRVPGAAAYHVMLDLTPHFGRPVVDRKDWKTGSMELSGLEAGTYFWRVAAMDKDGTEGAFSESSRFTVTRSAAGPPPPLSVDTLEMRGNVLQVKGRTEAGASLTVNGQRVDVRPDGSFDEFITFEGGRQTVVIRATGVGGGVSEMKRSVLVPY
jgi:hypothetical protein